MTLAHYSAEPFVLDRARLYPQTHGGFKPLGLWLSVEDDAEESWPAWCAANDFYLDALAHRTEIVLRADAPIRRITTDAELWRFNAEFAAPRSINPLAMIDWPRVQAHYGGLLIAPYLWTARLDLLWYYGWDCASACLWDLTCIDAVFTPATERGR
jgi:hypothetical protein